jgi:hypothetical protein
VILRLTEDVDESLSGIAKEILLDFCGQKHGASVSEADVFTKLSYYEQALP